MYSWNDFKIDIKNLSPFVLYEIAKLYVPSEIKALQLDYEQSPISVKDTNVQRIIYYVNQRLKQNGLNLNQEYEKWKKLLTGGTRISDYEFHRNPDTGKYEYLIYNNGILESIKSFDTKKEFKDWIRLMKNLAEIEDGRQPSKTWNEMYNTGARSTDPENIRRHIEEFGELTPRNDRGMGRKMYGRGNIFGNLRRRINRLILTREQMRILNRRMPALKQRMKEEIDKWYDIHTNEEIEEWDDEEFAEEIANILMQYEKELIDKNLSDVALEVITVRILDDLNAYMDTYLIANEEYEEDDPQPLEGEGKSKLYLHAIIFHKPYSLKQAKQEAQKIMKSNKKHYYRETLQSYRFRVIPKTKFIPKSYKTKVINSNISLIFGKLK